MKKKFIIKLRKFLKETSPRICEAVLVSASPRKKGRCIGISKEVSKLLKKSRTIKICDYKIYPCDGCLLCREGKCKFDDDFLKFVQVLKKFKNVVFISPVYFSHLPSQFKKIIDRCELFWESGKRPLRGKNFFLILIGDEKKNFIKNVLPTIKAFCITTGMNFTRGIFLQNK